MNCGIVIPFRNREEHLRTSSRIIKRHGSVYVIEQLDNKPFNRAKLLNIGYLEFKDEFNYFVAHDVDMIPDRADYSFCVNPCHLASEAEQFGYRLPYPGYFGGVTLLPKDKFEEVNGYSNEYWGWGGEDDELKRRFEQKNISIQRRDCKFISLPHISNYDKELQIKNKEKLKLPIDWEDGLSSCKYEVVHCEDFENYTLLQVNL